MRNDRITIQHCHPMQNRAHDAPVCIAITG